MAKKAQFSSRIGLIAATVGSAVGLGNVWRFPAEVQANGGASFLLIYVLCVLLLGIPVMLAEFALGRGGGSDAAGSFLQLGARRPWQAVGWLAIAASYLILCFYTVVGAGPSSTSSRASPATSMHRWRARSRSRGYSRRE